jgi:hypothetical protein
VREAGGVVENFVARIDLPTVAVAGAFPISLLDAMREQRRGAGVLSW